MEAEYRETADDFPLLLPRGVVFPREVPLEFDSAAKSEPGVGEAVAHFYWMCAWQDQFIRGLNAGDEDGQLSAIDKLEEWKSTEFYRDHYSDPHDLLTKHMLTPAREGNPEELIEVFNSGCSHYIQHNPVQRPSVN